MKRLTHTLAAGFGQLLAAGFVFAGIENTKHDLSSTGPNKTYGTDSVQLCVYCHTPHRAALSTPLWNHQLNTEVTYTAYESNKTGINAVYRDSSTIGQFREGFGPQESQEDISALCLSCHDGNIATGVLYNAPPDMTKSGSVIIGEASLGEDLSNDHPITPGYNCGSCHDAHENTEDHFLRDTMDGSRLCINCHEK